MTIRPSFSPSVYTHGGMYVYVGIGCIGVGMDVKVGMLYRWVCIYRWVCCIGGYAGMYV